MITRGHCRKRKIHFPATVANGIMQHKWGPPEKKLVFFFFERKKTLVKKKNGEVDAYN